MASVGLLAVIAVAGSSTVNAPIVMSRVFGSGPVFTFQQCLALCLAVPDFFFFVLASLIPGIVIMFVQE